MIEKTRDLSLLDFLDQLQMEYVVAELRAKIYKKEKDKTFWKDRVMPGKRQKIIDINERNPEAITIFSSSKEMDRVRDLVYKPWGLPNFFYRDDEQREELEIKDLLNYFAYNNEFLVRTGASESQRCTLISVLKDNERVTWANFKEVKAGDIEVAQIKIKGDSNITSVHLSNLIRIL